jgi:Concanavalin A-like lectin/glucanases superfamily
MRMAAQQPPGPYNGAFLSDGIGLAKKIDPQSTFLKPGAPWSIYCWIRTEDPLTPNTLVAGIGTAASRSGRYLAAGDGALSLWVGQEQKLSGPASLEVGRWHFVAVTYDGKQATLYGEGRQIAQKAIEMSAAAPVLWMAPEDLVSPQSRHFAGRIAGFAVTPMALGADAIRAFLADPPNFDLVEFEAASKNWPVQTRAQAGLSAPQDASTLPRSSAPPSQPVAKPAGNGRSQLISRGPSEWVIAGGWRLAAAPAVSGDGA